MAVFWRSLNLCFPGMLLTYFLNDFEIVPVAPTITGFTFVFTFQLLLLLLLLLTAIEFSLGGSSSYTSTNKTNKNKYTKTQCLQCKAQ